MPQGTRAFLAAFALGAVLIVGPLLGLMGRLVALGEIEIGVGADRTAALRGTLFADAPAQKLRDVVERKPEVLVLGSSRVGAVRAQMFSGCAGRSTCFYNATGGMPSIRTGLDLLRTAAPDDTPRLLILGIDVWDLDPAHVRAVNDNDQYKLRRDLRGQLDHALAVTRSAAQVVVTDPDVRGVVLGLSAVPSDTSGLAAIVHRTGYRSDGSTEYPDDAWRRALAQSDATRSADYLRLVRIGGFEFEAFERVDEGAMGDLTQILDAARAAGTTVVAFTPPFSDAVAVAMCSQPHYAAGVAETYSTLEATFADRGIPFVDGLSLSDYGCGADEHIDGIHVSEVCAARILLALAHRPSGDPFAGYLDADALARRLAARSSPFALPSP